MLNQKPLLNKKSSNICIISQEHFLIKLNTSCFYLSKQIHNLHDIRFHKTDHKVTQDSFAIQQFEFDCLYGIIELQNTPVLVFVVQSQQVGHINQNTIYQVQKVRIVKFHAQVEQPFIPALQRSFQLLKLYYCREFDISKRLQLQYVQPKLLQRQKFTNFCHTLKYKYYPPQLLTIFISGFAKSVQSSICDKKVKITLISRGDYCRLGRRWLRRGLSHEGYAANQFQTEIIIQICTDQKRQIYSYVQQRGSIPLFWQQFPCFEVKASLKICQDREKNERIMKKYLIDLVEKYKNIILLNLINKNGQQQKIGNVFQSCFNNINLRDTKFIWFDYGGQYSRRGKQAFEQLLDELNADISQNYFCMSSQNGRDYKIESIQNKVIRTNCMDCLDRTNYIQNIISRAVCIQIQSLISSQENKGHSHKGIQSQDLQIKLKTLWKENGIKISMQYSGTSTMKNDFLDKGKRTIGGAIDDFFIGLHRFYLGHFVDYYNQNCIDLHFGRINFQQDAQQFNGSLWKKVFKLTAFSGTAIFPLLILGKKIQTLAQVLKQKWVQRVAAVAGSFVGLFLGVLVCRLAGKSIIQQPISRKYELM